MADEPNIIGTPTFWRATVMMPRFFVIDARITIVITLLVLHLRLWTLFVVLITAAVLWGAEHFGYRFPNAVRFVRNTFAGPQRYALPRERYRRSRDFGFEMHPLTAPRLASAKAKLANATHKREALETKEKAAKAKADDCAANRATAPKRKPHPAGGPPIHSPLPGSAALAAE